MRTSLIVILLTIVLLSLPVLAQERHLNGFGGVTVLNPTGTMIFDTDIMRSEALSQDSLVIAYDMSSATTDNEIYDFSPKEAYGVMDAGPLSQDVVASNGVAQPFYLSSDNFPSAIYYNDKTYVVWNGEIASPSTPDPYITYFDHTTKDFAIEVKIADGTLTDDYHGAPIIIIDNNGYIHIFYGSHGTDLEYSKSDNPEDISSWSAQSIPATNVTYPSALKHPNGDIYIFYRRGEAGFPKKAYSYVKSTDNGATWDAFVDVIDFFTEGYAIYGSNPELFDNDQIHISWRELNESTSARTTLYHAILNISDDKMYAIDGTDLGSVVDRTEAQANLIVDIKEQVCAGTLHLDNNGIPYMIYCSQPAPGTEFNATFAYWNGSSWVNESIVISGDIDQLDSTSDFIIHSPTNIEAYITTEGATGFGGDMERWSWNGATWTQEEIILTETEAGVALNNPKIPLNYSSDLKMFFTEVDSTDFSNADLQIYLYPEIIRSILIPLVDSTFGQARDFDGYNDYVNTTLDIPPDKFTLIVAIEPDSTSVSSAGILSKRTPGNEWRLYFHTDRSVRLTGWEDDSTVTISLTSNAQLTLNQLYIIGLNWDGLEACIWIDGSQDNCGNRTGNVIQDTTALITLGEDIADSDRYFNGPIDEVLIFSDAMDNASMVALTTIQHYITIGGGSASVPQRYGGLILALPWLIVAGIMFTMFYIAFLAWRKSLKGEW